MDDRQLLQRFVEDNSQEAFAALTARYLSLVYSVCRRELGDADLAEDMTQAVFLILARKAPTLRREVVLSGWLFQTARFAARNARTSETRRKAYEEKAADAVREQQMDTEDAAWTEIEPLLNQSLAALRDAERECVLLRFFQGMSFAETGASLGLSEEAARKRVTRALEKMRRFFVKNGVVVPAAALAVLLTARAAKAAPAGLAPAIAQSTAGVLAGHTTAAALTGSHAYQLSEGVMKAMKIIQVKIAAGIAAAIVIGASAYAIAAARTVSLSATPGHVLQQVPGKIITATQIAERCRAAYAALESYQGTATVDSQTVTGAFPWPLRSHNSATIQFVRPGKLRAAGKYTTGEPFSYISDGIKTEQTNLYGAWYSTPSTEKAIDAVTGVAQSAATTIPTLLLGTNRGMPLPLRSGATLSPEVREDMVDGQPCFVLTAHLTTSQRNQETSLWIDEKTFLVCRSVSEIDAVIQATIVGNQSIPATTAKTYNDQRITNQHLNEVIPDSTFTLPPVQ